MSSPMDAYIDNLTGDVENMLATLIDEHDCTGSPEDGCEACLDIALYAADLSRINKFLKKAYADKNLCACAMCEAYQDEKVSKGPHNVGRGTRRTG